METSVGCLSFDDLGTRLPKDKRLGRHETHMLARYSRGDIHSRSRRQAIIKDIIFDPDSFEMQQMFLR
jgi:hypothetical protein